MMLRTFIGCTLSATVVASHTPAQSVFQDHFTHDLSVLWGNERGNWTASGGTYGATQPSNNPLTFSSAPYRFGDLVFECDIVNVDDGGVWLHADDAGENGVLLVLAHQAIYWHNVVNGGTPQTFGEVANAFTTGQTVHLRVTVVGNTFSAYLNGSQTPATTHTTALFPTGKVGLYDFRASSHNYDNVSLSGSCIGDGCCALVSRHPSSLVACPNASAVFMVEGAGVGPLEYRWQAEVGDGLWCNLTDLQYGGGCLDNSTATFQGVWSPVLTINGVTEADETSFRCLIFNSCGEVFSQPAQLTVCPPDFDCDGFVSGVDFDMFVTAFETGGDSADFDGDGFLTGIDYDLYVQSFEAGC